MIGELVEHLRGWILENLPKLWLESPATDAEIAELERALGWPLPPQLSQLWLAQNGGVLWPGLGGGPYARFLSTEETAEEQSSLLAEIEGEYDESASADARLTLAELSSQQWVAFAGQDHDRLAVCATTGRVAVVEHGWPPLLLVAGSIDEFLQTYWSAVCAGRYSVKNERIDGPSLDELFGVKRS